MRRKVWAVVLLLLFVALVLVCAVLFRLVVPREDVRGPEIDHSNPLTEMATSQAKKNYMGLRDGYPGTLNNVDDNGYTLLHYCAKYGYEDFAKKIIENPKRSFDLDTQDKVFGNTPFLLAIVHGHRNIAELLRESGADVNAARGPDGQNAAILAARNNRKELIPYLHRIGVDFSATDEDGRTAMDHAKRMEHQEMVELLTRQNTKKPPESTR